MGLFKSRDERRIERDLEVRKGLAAIKRNIKSLEKNERDYLVKARRAKRIAAPDQLEFLKKTLKRTAAQRRMLERQLLNLETAMQIKNQAEAHAQFASSMAAISRSIGEMFAATDMAKTQRDFEAALAKAETMEQRMEIFLDMSAASMTEGAETTAEDAASDAEIDRMIEEEAAAEEGKGLDEEISKGLKEIEKELGK
ncbi:MAG: hypothetical protein L0216_21935 [Planctomycetales bacterium]|nr:hypothetical protein [Planctomycetales bacterium]